MCCVYVDHETCLWHAHLLPETAAVEAEYGTAFATAVTAAAEEMATMCPEFLSNMAGRKAFNV
jgi:hypothetical protein